MNQKDIRYKNEIEFLKQKLSSYHKKLSIILGEDYMISNNNNNYEISQFSLESNKKKVIQIQQKSQVQIFKRIIVIKNLQKYFLIIKIIYQKASHQIINLIVIIKF